MDKEFLKEMFFMQAALHIKSPDKELKLQAYINQMGLALIMEVGEALNETRWKSWKNNQDFNQDNFKNELIDCWKFLLNLTMASGMKPEELYNRFKIKHDIVIERFKKGY